MATPSDNRSEAHDARRFDGLAETFDRRAGVDAAAAAGIAASVVEIAGGAPGGHIALEIGAGTGEVGQHLATLARRYVGVDASWPMLGVFTARMADRSPGARPPLLVQADADRHWPVRAGSVTVVFASRVAHLLAPDHVVAESRRVCRSGGCFLVGRVERTGVKTVLRQQREAILARRGVSAGRPGARGARRLFEALAASGGVPVPAQTVASWTATTTAQQVIAGWGAMTAMGGQNVDPSTRASVLDELREWAAGELGDLDRLQPFTEAYTVEGVRLA